MNRIQKNKQVMGNSVIQTLDLNNSTWSGSALFSATVVDHKANMASIADWELKQQQALELKGLVQDKNLLRFLMVNGSMVRIISAIRALAASTNNNQLATSVNYSRSKLLNMSDTAFFTASENVKLVATNNAAALVPFGISAPFLASYSLDVTAFDNISKKPKAFRGQLKDFTTKLEQAVAKMMAALRTNMDNQVRSLFPATDFSAAYFNSRIIYKYNQNTTELRGTVIDITTGKHIRNVLIELVNYPSPEESSFRHTNQLGNYSFKKLDMTKATLRIRAVGYTVAEYSVNITKLKVTDFDIVLIPEKVEEPINA